MQAQLITGIGLMIFPILLSLTLHEYGHARMALAFGDPTAKLLGRVTINPLAHLDVIGTLGLFLGPIGWAKPVPVNPNNLQPRRLGDIAVSLAGVGMNLLLMVAAAMVLNAMAAAGVFVNPDPAAEITVAGIIAFMLALLVIINLSLLLFNLLPLYPLDGHHVVRELLPAHEQQRFMQFQVAYGQMCLMGMIVLPWLVQNVLHQPALNPIGRYILAVQSYVVPLLLSEKAEFLFRHAWRHYSWFLPW